MASGEVVVNPVAQLGTELSLMEVRGGVARSAMWRKQTASTIPADEKAWQTMLQALDALEIKELIQKATELDKLHEEAKQKTTPLDRSQAALQRMQSGFS